MNIGEKLSKAITEAISDLKLPDSAVSLEHPTEISMGDYSCNVALGLAKKAGMKPKELAERISEKLTEKIGQIPEVEKIEVAGPGFINFYLSLSFLGESIKAILADEKFGENKIYEGKKVLMEYTDPNAFKVFHIGHLMSNSIGESISRVLQFSGADVVRICYPSDIGLHIAKAVWAIRKKISEIPKDEDPIDERTGFLGKCYVEGTNAYESDSTAKKEIDEINKSLFEKSDDNIQAIYKKGRQWSLDHFEQIYKKLGTKFDRYIYESEVGKKGIEIVNNFIDKGIFEKSNGAVIFPGEKYGLHTRVFINSAGFPTYETKEVGLNVYKFEQYKGVDESIIITGNEQNEYFQVLQRVLGLIDEKIGSRTKHFGHGMLRFADGKMSSRTGKVITGESLLKDVEKLVWEKIANRKLSNEEKQDISQKVAVGAIRYSILRQAKTGNIVYDFSKSISFEGDSGPYLQYSYARAASILRKVGAVKSDFEIKNDNFIARLLYRFGEVVSRAVTEHEPHHIATYLINIAGAFNNFYANNPILDSGEEETSRIALTSAFAKVMKKGLWLLGIEAPEKM